MTEESLLEDRNYTVIIAKSPLDRQPTSPNFTEAWQQAQSALLALCQKCAELDPDCLTLYSASLNALNSDRDSNYSSQESLIKLLESSDRTQPIDLVSTLKIAIQDYFTRKSHGETKRNGEIILVILDREPPNRIELIKLLVRATQKMETQEELGITFIQVGEDALTRGFLKSVDDDLATAGAQFNIADTKYTSELQPQSLTDVLIGALYG